MKKLNKFPRVVAALALLGLSTGTQAGLLYATDGAGTGSSTLYTIDHTTGAVLSTIGAVGVGITGLAFDPLSGTLFGVENNSSGSGGLLYTINTTTGAGTLIGGGNLGAMADISFDAAGNLFGWNEGGSDSLAMLNTGTGMATIVGPFGAFTRGSGLAFDLAGTLWSAGEADSGVASRLNTINAATGASTGTLGLSGFGYGRLGGLAVDPMTGTLYASDGCSGGSPACSQNLLTINTTTGVVSSVGMTVFGIDAIAFAPMAMPEPGSLLLVGAGLLGGLLTMARRRRSN